MAEINVENANISVLKRTEPDNDDNFFVQLKKWQNMMTDEDVLSPYDAWKKSVDFEANMVMNEKDKKLMGICSNMMGLFKDKHSLDHQEYKKRSVQIQQEALKEVVSRFDGGKFEDDKAPEYFLATCSVFKNLKDRKFIDDDYCLFAGLRGMVGATLLFAKSGFQIDLPEVNWDANYDIDLLVSRKGKSYSVSVKSEIDYKDPDTDEAFSVRVDKRPSGLPQGYYDKYRKHIWINIPNITTPDADVFCEESFRDRAISNPKKFMPYLFLAKLGPLGVDTE